jgi:hypothetical protein
MSHDRFRHLMLVFAVALGVQSAWVILPESISAGAIHLPPDEQAAAGARLQRVRARWAASLGFLRGDLWADSAVTYADLIFARNPDGTQQAARSVTERALAYAPHRSDVWLLFALLSYRFDWGQLRLADALKMSYYTGANESELVPLRIFVSVSSPALDDNELQEMVRRDIRMILTGQPDLKPVLVGAYKNASTTNKRFMENVISEIDQQFLAYIRDSVR